MLQRRWVTLFGLILLMAGSSQPGRSKDNLVTFTANHEKLGAVLRNIQEQGDVRLVYVNSIVDSFTVYRKFNDTPYEAVRKSLLGTPFDFVQQTPDLWVIVPRSQTQGLPATLTGRITDIYLQQPITGVNVYIDGSDLGTTTNRNGEFILSQIPPGKTTISVKRIGYHDLEFAVLLRGNRRKHVELALEPEPVFTQEVVIEEKILPKENSIILLEQKITKAQLQTPPLKNDGEVFELLHQQPGVSRRDLDDVYPHVEGGSATEVVIELDGMPIYVPTFGKNRRSVFASTIVESITLHRSGFGVEYGDAMSGVISIQTKDVKDVGFTTKATASLTGLSVNFSKNTNKLGVSGVWRNGKFNNGLDYFGQWEGLDIFTKLEYRPAKNHTVTLLALISRGAFVQSNSLQTGELVSQNLGARYDFEPGKKTHVSAIVYQSSLDDEQSEVGFKLKARTNLTGMLSATAGIDFYNLDTHGTVALDSLDLYKVARNIDTSPGAGNFYLPIATDPADLFMQRASVLTPYLGVNLSHRLWRISVGARLPADVRLDGIYFEHRAKFVVMPTNFLNLSVSQGRYYQFTDRSYASEAKSGDNRGRGEFLVKVSNAEPSYADHFRLESGFHLTRSYRFSIAYFDKKYHFNDRAYLTRINSWFWTIPLQGGLSRGYEYWLGKTTGQLQGWISYTMNNQAYQTELGTYFKAYFNRDKILNISMAYFLNASLKLQGQYFRSSGYPERLWSPEHVTISRENTPEVFAEKFLTDPARLGATRQYALGLTWSFPGFSNENLLTFVASQTVQETGDGFDGGFEFWASISFAK
ncbi:TonB-dependent receptor [candidate division KSB1 bacterium]|nr:TonB-dependent receptor [candidate division KSB1 bacterium]